MAGENPVYYCFFFFAVSVKIKEIQNISYAGVINHWNAVNYIPWYNSGSLQDPHVKLVFYTRHIYLPYQRLLNTDGKNQQDVNGPTKALEEIMYRFGEC